MAQRQKIAKGLTYLWLNLLSRRAQLKFLAIFARTNTLRKSISFGEHLDGFRHAVVILPTDPLEVLLTQRCLVALKEHRPDMKVEVIAEARSKEIVESNPYLDGGLYYAAKDFYFNCVEFKALVASVKERSWDACFLMNRGENPLHCLLAVHTRAPLRAGFAEDELFPFINLAIRPKKETVHEADRYGVLLKTLGIKFSKSRIAWQIPKNAKKDLEGLLANSGYDFNGKLIAIDAGPSLSGRALPPALIKYLIENLKESAGLSLVVVASADPGKGTERDLKIGESSILPLYKESPSVAAALVERCDAVVAPNTLLYQFSVLMNKPVVGLFEENEAQQWAGDCKDHSEVMIEKRFKDIEPAKVCEKIQHILKGENGALVNQA